MSEDLRGVFFIVKGQYKKGVSPCFVNKATNDTSWIGGYDPTREDTEEWYMCLDKYTYQCLSCGGDLKKVVKSVYNTIVKYKDLKHYLHHVSKTTSDDTYERKYLGHSPLTPDQVTKKAEGRCPRVSSAMRCLYDEIYNTYGDFYSDLVKEMEDSAYRDLKDSTPFRKAKKLVKKIPTNNTVVEKTPTPPKKEAITETPKLKLGSIKKRKVILKTL